MMQIDTKKTFIMFDVPKTSIFSVDERILQANPVPINPRIPE